MKVSVIVATYGHIRWKVLAMKRALPSLEGQRAHEVIVRHFPDLVLVEARNAGAETATGDWLCFLDADDELAPGYINAMNASGTEPALRVPAVQYVYPMSQTEPVIPNGAGTRPMLEINHACIGTVVPTDTFWKAGGFSPDYPQIEDYELWCRLVAEHDLPIRHVPDAVYRAYSNPGYPNRYNTTAAFAEHKKIRQRYANVRALSEPVAV